MVRAIRSGFRWVSAATAVLLLAVVSIGQVPATRPVTTPYTTWRDYGGSADSMQYSALTQIDRTNVARSSWPGSTRSPATRAAAASTRSLSTA